MQGSLVIGHDGSYMPHLANNLVTCAAVFYCSHTNQYPDVTWVERSTKKAANNYRTITVPRYWGGAVYSQLLRRQSPGTTYWVMVLLPWGAITWGWCNMATVPGAQCWRSNHNLMCYGTSKALWLHPELEDRCNTCTVTQTSTCQRLRCPQHSK